MTVKYGGANTGGQMVPMKGFHGQVAGMTQPAGLVHGFDAKFYYIKRSLNRMPSVEGRLPDFRAVTDQIKFPNYQALRRAAPGIPASRIAVVWSGYIQIEQAGEYAFSTSSDDGSHLWIGNEMVLPLPSTLNPTPSSHIKSYPSPSAISPEPSMLSPQHPRLWTNFRHKFLPKQKF